MRARQNVSRNLGDNTKLKEPKKAFFYVMRIHQYSILSGLRDAWKVYKIVEKKR